MIIVSYDFHSNKRRARFSKFLKQYGRRIQYSVFELKNSHRILQNVLTEIELRYKASFTTSDSILIFGLCEPCKGKIIRYGYPVSEEKEVVFF